MEQWTILDTKVRTAAENVALDDTLLTCRNKNLIPNTIRLLQFSPNAVLVGFHQSVEQEVRIDYCKEHGIDINRRITGGGTIYLDKPQIGWELIASRKHPLIPKDIDELYERMCECTVKGLNQLGVNLRIPIEKLKDKELESARERVTCLKWELGYLPSIETIKDALKKGFSEVFNVELVNREITEKEKELLKDKIKHIQSDSWIYGVRRPIEHRRVLTSIHKAPGGLIRTSLVADIMNKRIQAALRCCFRKRIFRKNYLTFFL